MSGMTKSIAENGTADGATLLKQCKSEQRPVFYLDYGKGRCIRLPYAVGKELSESPLVTPREPGLLASKCGIYTQPASILSGISLDMRRQSA